MRALDIAAIGVTASVVAICVGAIFFSAREAGRNTGRRIVQRPPGAGATPGRPPAPADRGAASREPHRRTASHPPPEIARRRERAAARFRRPD